MRPQRRTSSRCVLGLECRYKILHLLQGFHLTGLSFPLSFRQVAQVVKREMESAVKLYVKLKAKVKVGPSWGNLQEIDL